ncbi:MAG: hypothetical protein WCB68_20985 [Pyrinomonadaceae bacterium]
MRHLLFTLALCCSLVNISLSQQINSPASDSDIRLSKDHPAIYITFERRGKAINIMDSRLAETGETSKSKEKGEDIWLRLHNNSRWAILFPTWSLYFGKKVSLVRLSDGKSVLGLSDGMEVNAKYQVVEDDGRVVPYGGDSYSESWLPPGRSIIFSVSREHLSKRRSIYIYFNYEWENGQVYSNNLEPEHRSMYWGYRLEEDSK